MEPQISQFRDHKIKKNNPFGPVQAGEVVPTKGAGDKIVAESMEKGDDND